MKRSVFLLLFASLLNSGTSLARADEVLIRCSNRTSEMEISRDLESVDHVVLIRKHRGSDPAKYLSTENLRCRFDVSDPVLFECGVNADRAGNAEPPRNRPASSEKVTVQKFGEDLPSISYRMSLMLSSLKPDGTIWTAGKYSFSETYAFENCVVSRELNP